MTIGVRTATLFLFVLSATPLLAQERLVRTFAQEEGLTAPPVWALVQDSAGFLWVGAEGGLFRFDGRVLRRWGGDALGGPVSALAVAADGTVAAHTRAGRVYEVGGSGGAAEIALPGPPVAARSLAYDRRGDLWLIRADTVARRTRSGTWTALPPDAFAGERPTRIIANAEGGVDVTTNGGIWRVSDDAAPRRTYAGRYVFDAVPVDTRRTIVLLGRTTTPNWVVLEVEDGVARELHGSEDLPAGRPIALVERHGTLWVALDHHLVAIRPGERLEVLGRAEGISSGGPLLVDREASLWLGSYTGLLQFPEPETRVWAEASGLPSRHTRYLARTGRTLWVMTWGGAGFLHRGPDGWRGARLPAVGQSAICTDASGAGWSATERAVLALRDTVVVAHPWPTDSAVSLRGCAPARDGGLWLATNRGLHHHRGGRVQAVPSPHTAGVVMEDSRARVWSASGERVCQAAAARILDGAGDAWQCETLPGLQDATGIVELPDGRIWVSSPALGVVAYDGASWSTLHLGDVPTRTVFGLVPSPRGGVWLVGHGILMRVRAERDGWELLEELTRWHGIPGAGGGHLVEEPDGTIWIATSRGVVEVPAAARFAKPPAPPVALVDASVDGAPLSMTGALVLPHGRNRIELQLAALSFREPARLVHQVRLGPDEPWTESRGAPSFRWVDLRPGRYEVQYRASLDGVYWSAQPLRFGFRVRPPWWGTWWFYGLALLASIGLALAAYRARVAYLLGLERQRTRIALDLHDEVGSGLASVGILSGILASDGVQGDERHRMAREIAGAAEELGHSLSDIVWSLDPHAAGMQDLATRLAEHGERLCAGDGANFRVEFPERWPEKPPDVDVRRNVLLVGLEALHNAARHGQAREVVLSLRAEKGGAWRMTVRDDGLGIPVGSLDGAARGNGGSGHGLRGMRRRADEIGARLDIASDASHGTTVELRFDAQPQPRGLLARLRRRARIA